MSEPTSFFEHLAGKGGEPTPQMDGNQQFFGSLGANQEPPAGDPPAGDPPAPPAGDPPSGDPPGGDPPAPPAGNEYAEFGTPEELRQRLTRFQELETEATQLREQFGKVKPLLEVAPLIETPFVTQDVAKVNTFMRATGIHDIRLAGEVMGTSDEELKSNPVKAIVMSKLLTNPSLAAVGMDKLYRAAARESGINPETAPENWDPEVKETLEVKAAEALITIGEKRKSWEQPNDFFANLQHRKQEQDRLLNEARQNWDKEIPVLVNSVSKLTREVEVEGIGKVTSEVALSPDEVKSVVEAIKPQLLALPVNDQGKAQAKNLVETVLRSAAIDKFIQSAIKAYDSQHRANIEQQIRKEKSNGKPVGSPPVGTPPASQASSPFADHVKGGSKAYRPD